MLVYIMPCQVRMPCYQRFPGTKKLTWKNKPCILENCTVCSFFSRHHWHSFQEMRFQSAFIAFLLKGKGTAFKALLLISCNL